MLSLAQRAKGLCLWAQFARDVAGAAGSLCKTGAGSKLPMPLLSRSIGLVSWCAWPPKHNMNSLLVLVVHGQV